MESRNLIDITGVAERLGVTERHVRRLVFERRIPFIKWGHLLRFDPDEIERWLDEARVEAVRSSYDASASSARIPAGPLTTSSRRTS
jgi:excisionase family DNA binding protein